MLRVLVLKVQRVLTAGEIALARAAFGVSIDYARVKLSEGPGNTPLAHIGIHEAYTIRFLPVFLRQRAPRVIDHDHLESILVKFLIQNTLNSLA